MGKRDKRDERDKQSVVVFFVPQRVALISWCEAIESEQRSSSKDEVSEYFPASF